MFGSYPFIPGSYEAQQVPLSRYLPPIPGGIVESWLKERVSPGDWILDPFGASPQLASEAARAGYRVLVAAYNPIARFLLELAADPPTESELRAALADLAISPKGEERLEPHIRSLYLTECLQCGKSVSAEAFIWKRGDSVPTSRIYNCPNCMESGEFPTSESDAKRAAHFGKSSLHHARALERVAALDDPDKDITFYINSPGGSVSAGLAIYDTMQYVKSDIATLCMGQASSMGALILAAGTKGKRYALPNSRILIHQPLGGFHGQASDIDIHAKEILKIRNRLNRILAEHTGRKVGAIAKDTERDNFMSAEDAKKYGIVDKVLAKRENLDKEEES